MHPRMLRSVLQDQQYMVQYSNTCPLNSTLKSIDQKRDSDLKESLKSNYGKQLQRCNHRHFTETVHVS